MGRRILGADQRRRPVSFTLHPEAVLTLRALAAMWGCSQARAIERLLAYHDQVPPPT